ncbi:hypothetical protein JAAARDRAFT_75262 [Jaapia argillacea MUCL 33604]|uniref:RRM domain-containing protein n=1 Tax=Jaapia argillacea MUCL 33604 TaxID=933084 RepID=A0A067QMJ1_9AGAM|nr:hypothetical protein JAAARDRAFT_75262 [Jaapia argillacea MUCL 33604]
MSDAPAAPVTENGVPPVTQDKVEEEVPGFKVFAGNLAYSTTDDGLKSFFAPVQSEILSAQVIMRGIRSAGYGFVALSTEEAAQKAVELLNKTELDGRTVIIEIAKPAEEKDKDKKERKARRRLGRRGRKAPRGEITDAEASGEAEKVEEANAPASTEESKPKQKKKKAPRKRGGAAVNGTSETPATDATPAAEATTEASADASKRQPRPKRVRAPRPRRPAGEEPSGEPSKNMLFVANLGFSIDDDALRALFTEAGINVVSARVICKRWGVRRSQGYGFVDVGDEEEQKKAIEKLQGKDVGGREIAVKVAVNSQIRHDEAEGEKAEGAHDAVEATTETTFSGLVPFFVVDLGVKRNPTSLHTGTSHRDIGSTGNRTTMADDEDDYLSDKFLLQASNSSSSSGTHTYAEKRKAAQRRAHQRHEQNKLKSRRELELESREAGLSKSLFERAKEEESTLGKGNKALAMMMKMGFKPGQALGQTHDAEPIASSSEASRSHTPVASEDKDRVSKSHPAEPDDARGRVQHRTTPLPLNEWAGKKGIGLGKRSLSQSIVDRAAKMAKMAEETNHDTFRNRAREDFLERQAEGRLAAAQRTCVSLDEKAGKKYNTFWLNPNNPDDFPAEIMEVLTNDLVMIAAQRRRDQDSMEARLRAQMRQDALQPLSSNSEEDTPLDKQSDKESLSPELVREATAFLRLNARQRLEMVLSYLRDQYSYCFWCGNQYDDQDDMERECPGEDEDAHD